MKINIEWIIEEVPGFDGLAHRSAKTALECEHITTEVEVSLLVVDNKEIQQINQEQRDKDEPTDVLSFPMIDYTLSDDVQEAIEEALPNPDSDLVYLGDIVISWEKVLEQSEAYGHSVEREFSFLIVHSMLHLLGYDHMDEEEEQEMIQHQKVIMDAIGIKR